MAARNLVDRPSVGSFSGAGVMGLSKRVALWTHSNQLAGDQSVCWHSYDLVYRDLPGVTGVETYPGAVAGACFPVIALVG